MKVLLDTCVWGGALRHLETAGIDVVWTGSWPEDPGDEEILAFTHKEQRVLVSLDKDFGENWRFYTNGRTTASCGWSISLPATRDRYV
jgi:predicted nuclease of predicted toxin-antitoxin system